ELWRRGKARDLARGLAAAIGVFAAATVPFLVLAPHGLWWAVHRQLVRPLQVESLAAAVFVAAHQIGGLHLHVKHGSGSANLVGHGPSAAGALTSIATVFALLLVYVLYARGKRGKEQLVTACVAAIVAYIAFSKVFSPQYLVWLIPLIPLVGGRRGLRAAAIFAVILGMTQIWSPYRYYEYWHGFPAWLSWLVIVRDLVVVVLFAVLLWPDATGRPEPPRAVQTV
ncbi:MAG TPA: hypothetical protein VLE97_00830, partial [Gaiellaceae bacterium]|nr:hypothetical protein [Gaiellaceae bacterium]